MSSQLILNGYKGVDPNGLAKDGGDTRIGVALFGVGNIGMVHFKNLVSSPRVKIHYIVEAGPALDKARKLVSQYHLSGCEVVDIEQTAGVYADTKVAAVIVCAPTREHEKIVTGALEHGKAVFCEKPISEHFNRIKFCYDIANKVGRPLFCSFNRRFDPCLRSIYERCKAGQVGNLHIIKSCSRDHPRPSIEYLKISGGMFQDTTIHDIDLVCWLMGERPHTVYTVANANIPEVAQIDDVDTIVINLKFPSGAIAILDFSRHAVYGYDQRVEVFGSSGMLLSENQRPIELTALQSSGTVRDVIKPGFSQRYAESYVNSMEHFLNVVEGKELCEVTADDAYYTSKIATACEESHKSGNPVQITYD